MPDWFSFGKIRYSYSQVGISPVSYATRSTFGTQTYTDGFTNGLTFPYAGGVNGMGISNTLLSGDLNPERQVGNEVGLNVNLWKGLIDLDYTYYNQKSTDLLLFLPTPRSSGYAAKYTNAGEMTNQGHEIYMSINAIRKDDFQWSIGLNWAKNISEVTALAPGVEEVSIEAAFSSIGSFAIVGEPLGVFYGTRWDRVDMNDNNSTMLIQSNGLPAINAQSGNVGSPLPNWLGGLRNTFTYKRWGMSFLFDFRNGGDVYNGTFARLNNLGRTEESADRERSFTIPGVYQEGTIINGVDVSGEQNKTPVSARTYWRSYNGDAGGASEQFVETVNWVRLRDLSLNYSIPVQDSKVFNSINLSFTARNLWLSTNYKGVDPETSLTGAGSNIGGFDYFNNPGSKSFMFGASFTF
jgi:hypothetical protein